MSASGCTGLAGEQVAAQRRDAEAAMAEAKQRAVEAAAAETARRAKAKQQEAARREEAKQQQAAQQERPRQEAARQEAAQLDDFLPVQGGVAMEVKWARNKTGKRNRIEQVRNGTERHGMLEVVILCTHQGAGDHHMKGGWGPS